MDEDRPSFWEVLKSRWWIFASCAVVLIVATVIIIIVSSPDDGGADTPVRETFTIAGRQYSTNTVSLELTNMGIDDISEIVWCANLTSLNLADNSIADVTPIGELNKLTYLDLTNNDVTDVEPLKGLAGLETLILTGNPLSDEDITELRSALPDCWITFDGGDAYSDGYGDTDGADLTEYETISYEEFIAAEAGSVVTIDTYVQLREEYDADMGSVSLYAQDADGAYHVYYIYCTQEEYERMTPGTRVIIRGNRDEWGGEAQINGAQVEIMSGSYTPEPVDVTSFLGTDALKEYQNFLVTVKGATIEDATGAGDAYFAYDDGENLLFYASVGGESYTFEVSSRYCYDRPEVYSAVEGMNVGDTVDITGYLCWYDGANPTVTGITVR